MTEHAYSAPPYRAVQTTSGDWRILDGAGDTIAALAGRTPDHGPEEQRGHALLFATSPVLAFFLRALVARIPATAQQASPELDILVEGATQALGAIEPGDPP
ncbi:MAG: hypothetical protein ACK4RV_11645 [Caulobacter sp.]